MLIVHLQCTFSKLCFRTTACVDSRLDLSPVMYVYLRFKVSLIRFAFYCKCNLKEIKTWCEIWPRAAYLINCFLLFIYLFIYLFNKMLPFKDYNITFTHLFKEIEARNPHRSQNGLLEDPLITSFK